MKEGIQRFMENTDLMFALQNIKMDTKCLCHITVFFCHYEFECILLNVSKQ